MKKNQCMIRNVLYISWDKEKGDLVILFSVLVI
jgi:hypothetical protein